MKTKKTVKRIVKLDDAIMDCGKCKYFIEKRNQYINSEIKIRHIIYKSQKNNLCNLNIIKL